MLGYTVSGKIIQHQQEGEKMKNLPFVLWMLGYPAINTWSEHFPTGKTYSDGVEAVAAIIIVVIWVGVGKLLYEPKDKK
jgi:hypothetical protein